MYGENAYTGLSKDVRGNIADIDLGVIFGVYDCVS
jgi:hypothetical protein